MSEGDWGFRISDCGLGIGDWGLRIADCGLGIADCGLRIGDWGGGRSLTFLEKLNFLAVA